MGETTNYYDGYHLGNHFYYEHMKMIDAQREEIKRMIELYANPQPILINTERALEILGFDTSGSMNETEPTTTVKFLNKKK